MESAKNARFGHLIRGRIFFKRGKSMGIHNKRGKSIKAAFFCKEYPAGLKSAPSTTSGADHPYFEDHALGI